MTRICYVRVSDKQRGKIDENLSCFFPLHNALSSTAVAPLAARASFVTGTFVKKNAYAYTPVGIGHDFLRMRRGSNGRVDKKIVSVLETPFFDKKK